MSIFAIADLHLSTLDSTNKSMEVFGARWSDYINRIKTNWKRLVGEEDTVIIPGDVSWATSLEEAEQDFRFLNSLPGKKIIGKGNHDFWWSTMSKHQKFFEKNGISGISFLHNNAYEVEDFIICGTRGWFVDEDSKNAPDNADFEKLINRETLRLSTSLKAAKILKDLSPSKEIIAFLHFPPFWNDKPCDSIISLLSEYGIKRVYFGHIHGNYTVMPTFSHEGISMSLISADYLAFVPKVINK